MTRMRNWFTRVGLALACLVLLGPSALAREVPPAAGEERIALVIGNGNYKSAPLKNPINDGRAFAAKLKALGFEVIERENLATRELAATLRQFRSRLKPGAVTLFFYAGHGVQVKGVNYLPAVDADISSEEDVPLSSIDLDSVLSMLGEAKTRLNLVFLDACRNNPFPRAVRGGANGLAKVEAPSGTLISFATRPGSTASDGNGGHGLYTEHLLKVVDEPGLPIEQVLKRVVGGVKKESNGQQEPWMEGSIEGEFYFRPDAAAPAGTAVRPEPRLPPASASAASDGLTVELAFWNTIQSSTDPRDFQAYLDKYPQGQFAGLARTRAARAGAGTAAGAAPGAGAGAVAGAPAAGSAPDAVAAADPRGGGHERKLVAIAGFENKSTYGSDKLWDTSGQLLTSNLLELGVFRLVEWEKMKQLFDWHALANNELVKSPEAREKARKILLTEYFLSGAVTRYDVTQRSEVSALSKRKSYVTNVRVDLQIQDGATGEYLSGASGEAEERQEFSGDFSGGQSGTWDPKSGDQALDHAIQLALKKLIENYKRQAEEPQRRTGA